MKVPKPAHLWHFFEKLSLFLIDQQKKGKNAKGIDNYIIIKLRKRRDFGAHTLRIIAFLLSGRADENGKIP